MSSIVSNTFIESVMNGCHYSCTLSFWGRRVRFYADMSAIIERFTRVYSRFIDSNQCNVDITCCIVRRSALRPGPFLLVGPVLYELPDMDRYVEYAEPILFRHLLEQLDDYIVLHAGVVTRQGRAIVLYGQSGFGKTTLTLELMRRGYGFMSDEFCPLRISDCMVEPFERLVGLRKSSPFYSRTDPKHSFCLEIEGKLFFDCADMFPYRAAQPSIPGIFIEIVGEIDTATCPPGGVVLDIHMCCDCNTVPDALRRLPGVTVSEPIMQGSYFVSRVTASDRTGFVSRFNQIWQENSNEIISVFPYKGEIVSYDRMPKLSSVPAFDALTSLGSNIVNRAPGGCLLAAHGGKTSSLVMLLGRLLGNTSFYSLYPGQLAKRLI